MLWAFLKSDRKTLSPTSKVLRVLMPSRLRKRSSSIRSTIMRGLLHTSVIGMGTENLSEKMKKTHNSSDLLLFYWPTFRLVSSGAWIWFKQFSAQKVKPWNSIQSLPSNSKFTFPCKTYRLFSYMRKGFSS